MKNALKIVAFTLIVTAFYSYVGQMVPQKETYPPESREIRPDLTVDEMVDFGREIVGAKGTCLTCHTFGSDKPERFPDLNNIGRKAGSRKDGFSDIDYLAESLYDPDAYIVEGFAPGMPAVNKPPISLSDKEILTVIAYLQSLGSAPSVTMQTKLKSAGRDLAAFSTPGRTALSEEAAASATTKPVDSEHLDGEGLFKKYLCNSCHRIDAPVKLVGPSLYDAGNRLTTAQLYQAILEPDAIIAEGFPAGVMTASLRGLGFYDQITTKELKIMVDYLASQKGNK